MTATSGPGFSLKQENIGFACMTEVPCVIVNVMRGGPSTGLPTMPAQGDVMQARWGTHGDHPIIALVPNSVKECYTLTARALNLTERLRVPVVVLLDEIIGHTNEKVVLELEEPIVNRKGPDAPPDKYLPYRHTEDAIPPMATFAKDGYRFHVTGLAHDETGFPTNKAEEIDKLNRRLNDKLEIHRETIVDVVTTGCEKAEIGIFAYGSVARAANQAIQLAAKEGIDVGLIRPRTLWPFPDRELLELTGRIKKIIVPEMNLGQMAHEVEWAVRGSAEVIQFHRVDGQPIRPSQILNLIKEAVQVTSAEKA
jgi:2-oxoglutarate ferredoxin oxidoreductase subunit alpha